MRLRVATHNIMDGLKLRAVLPVYRHVHRTLGLHVLCLQEHVAGAAAAACRCLGRRFAVAAHRATPRLAIVYDRSRLSLRRLRRVSLPLLDRVPLWQRLYAGATPQRKLALVASFRLRARRPHGRGGRLTVANFHLDAAGCNSHRARQMGRLSDAVGARERPLVACGDTNAFSWLRSNAERELARVLSAMYQRHRARDVHADTPVDTHYFARAEEPKLGQRLAVAFGRFGVDFPRRYDVVAASACGAVARAVVTTAGSDHDLVWADLAVPRRRWGRWADDSRHPTCGSQPPGRPLRSFARNIGY